MSQYSYDESGAIFNFFLLTILTSILLPWTWYTFNPNKTVESNDISNCKCPHCVFKDSQKPARPISIYKSIALFIGWIFYMYVLYSVSTTEIAQVGEWNPWDILQVSMNADASEIKKAFRKKSLIYHPDKVAPEEKEEAEKKFIDISKAYQVYGLYILEIIKKNRLTDEETMENYRKTGNADGTASFALGLALPKWLVEKENNFLVLFIYALIFGIGLPFTVAKWWYSATEVNNSKIKHSTMGIYYRDLREGNNLKSLTDILVKAQEFQELISPQDVESLTVAVKEHLEKRNERLERGKKPSDTEGILNEKTSLLLVAYLSRLTLQDPILEKEKKSVVIKSASLVNGLLQIALTRFWLSSALSCIELSQYIVQALYFRSSPFLQLPFLDSEILKHFKTKKRNISSISDLLSLSALDRNDLLRSLEPEQRDVVVQVASQMPILKLKDAQIKVLGESVIFPNAICTLIVKLKLIHGSDLISDSTKEYSKESEPSKDSSKEEEEEEEPVNKEWWVNKEKEIPLAHAPLFPGEKRPVWWLILGDTRLNRVVTCVKVTDLKDEKTVFLKFGAPAEKGVWNLQLFIKSDSYLGLDIVKELKMVVKPSEEAPLIEEEDDISEPDEDTIAGQMEALRKQKNAAAKKEKKKVKKTSKHEAEDSTDSEEEISLDKPLDYDDDDSDRDDTFIE